MRTKLAEALLLVSIAACGIEDESTETSTDTQDLYGLGTVARSWGDTNGAVVPVCWEDPDAHLDIQIRVREILRETWESYANISFTGPEPSLPFGGLWGACSETAGRRIHVVFSEETNFRGKTFTSNGGAMVILIADRALGENYERFRYEVIHEFGHALGFAHEQQRPDNFVNGIAMQCGKPKTDEDYINYAPAYGGINLTPTYDVNSIMNYCNPAPGYLQDLSLGDIRGVRAAYGRRDVKGDIYQIDSDDQLHWYRHDGRTDGSLSWGYPSGNVVGTGWSFKDVFSSGESDGILYTVNDNNELEWRRHDGRVDGNFRWAFGSGNVIGYGWNFTQLFGAGSGVIYGISPYVPAHPSEVIGGGWIQASGGDLKWYRHTGREDGSYRWGTGSGNVVGTRWDVFQKVFSGGNGVIYAVTPYVPAHPSEVIGGGWIQASGGDLKWYRHLGQGDGTFRWAPGSGTVVGTGWGAFKEVFSGGDGVIYGVNSDDELVWYRHDGRNTGTFSWAPGSGSVVDSGWTFQHVVGDD